MSVQYRKINKARSLYVGAVICMYVCACLSRTLRECRSFVRLGTQTKADLELRNEPPRAGIKGVHHHAQH